MAANDDLNAFDEGLLGLEMAWQNTVNRMCIRLLTGNVALLDGNNLYDNTNHGNDITGGSGGVPSDAQWDAMQLKVAAQSGIGGKGFVRTPLKIALFPPALSGGKRRSRWAISASSAKAKSRRSTPMSTSIAARCDARPRAGAARQQRRDLVRLCAAAGHAYNATIIRAYFRGWGRNGRRQRWYDPETKCWNFELEGRVGVAAKQYRLTVRNAGS
jgi:hypothetical protein